MITYEYRSVAVEKGDEVSVAEFQQLFGWSLYLSQDCVGKWLRANGERIEIEPFYFTDIPGKGVVKDGLAHSRNSNIGVIDGYVQLTLRRDTLNPQYKLQVLEEKLHYHLYDDGDALKAALSAAEAKKMSKGLVVLCWILMILGLGLGVLGGLQVYKIIATLFPHADYLMYGGIGLFVVGLLILVVAKTVFDHLKHKLIKRLTQDLKSVNTIHWRLVADLIHSDDIPTIDFNLLKDIEERNALGRFAPKGKED